MIYKIFYFVQDRRTEGYLCICIRIYEARSTYHIHNIYNLEDACLNVQQFFTKIHCTLPFALF